MALVLNQPERSLSCCCKLMTSVLNQPEHSLSCCCKLMTSVLNQLEHSLSCCCKLMTPVMNQPERSLSCCCKLIAPVMNQPARWLSCHCKLMAPVWLDIKTTKQFNQEQMAWKMFHSGSFVQSWRYTTVHNVFHLVWKNWLLFLKVRYSVCCFSVSLHWLKLSQFLFYS